MAPVANDRVANRVLFLLLRLAGSTAYENASVLAYIAKEEGKNAAFTGTHTHESVECKKDLYQHTWGGIPHPRTE